MADMTTPAQTQTGPIGRPAKIAAVKAFADWLTDHPEAPVPTLITAHYVVSDQAEPEPARVAGVLRVLRQLDIRPIEGERTLQGDLMIASPDVHGLTIIYRAVAMKDAPRARTYLEPRQ